MGKAKLKVAIAGAAGRMGQRLCVLASQAEELELVGAWEAPHHPAVGKNGISANMQEATANADVYIEFTRPEPTLAHLQLAAKNGLPAVIGTTGFRDSAAALFKPLAKKIPIVWAPNMSVGVTLLCKIVEDATRALGRDFDAEIVELHHRWKEDAPSGTAKALLAAIQAGRGGKTKMVSGREGMLGQRKANEIGVFAVRGGDIVGDHTVYLSGLGERIELTHRAQSRDTFALGALRAARWVVNQQPGLYSMYDVLGWSR